MKRKFRNLQTLLYIISAIIVLIGMGSAILIYLTAGNDPDTILSYEDSKKFKHDLELYGGKANVFANELMRWFAGLWKGKTFAFTVACITFFISFGIFFIANHLPSALKSDARGKNNRTITDLKNLR